MEIKETGQYFTRGGQVVEVEEILSPGLYAYPVYGYLNDTRLMWTRDGKYFVGKPDHEWDLVEKVRDVEDEPADVHNLTHIPWKLVTMVIVVAIGTTIAFWAGRLSCLG